MPVIRGLYVIIDPDACAGRDAIDVAQRALAGGATMLQWRDKRREKGEQLPDARALRSLCAEHDALLIVNDHVDLALAVGADGVHLGQHDLPLDAARALTPDRFIIGVSTNNVEEARAAEAGGAGYVAVGAIFPTTSKEPERTRPASVDRLRDVRAAIDLPLVAIGGIDATNVDGVIEAGADAVAVIRAVCGADDPEAAARAIASWFAG